MPLLEQVVQPQDQSIRHIPLTQGQVAIVDAADYEWLMQWKWHAAWDSRGKRFYARRTGPGNRQIGMHREITSALVLQKVDHWNGDGLDNRRKNLRVCSHAQNCANQSRDGNKTCKFKGVTLRNANGKWRARIRLNWKLIYIGDYPSAEDAARAYDEAAIRYFGEFAHLNFTTVRT